MTTNNKPFFRDAIGLTILTLTGLLLFLPMMWKWRDDGDYIVHNDLIRMAAEEPTEFYANTPHFLYHAAGSLLYALGLSGVDAGAVVMVVMYLALLGVLYWQLRRYLPPTWGAIAVGVMTALGLTIVAPINFFTPQNLYLGYFPSHVYHNPTIIMMKPFAVLLFFAALALYGRKQTLAAWWAIPYALLTGVCLLAKPNFILAFVPALGLVTAYHLLNQARIEWQQRTDDDDNWLGWAWRTWTHTPVNWTVLLGGITFPAIAILVYQSMTWTSSGGIGVDPFRVFFEWTLHYDKNADQQILFKLVMSVAFALVVTLTHIKRALTDRMMLTAWLNLAISAAFAYLLVDYTVIAAGDFGWTGQIGAYMTFVAAAIFLAREYRTLFTQGMIGLSIDGRIRLLACSLVLVLHVIAGIHWYVLHLQWDMGSLLYGAW